MGSGEPGVGLFKGEKSIEVTDVVHRSWFGPPRLERPFWLEVLPPPKGDNAGFLYPIIVTAT